MLYDGECLPDSYYESGYTVEKYLKPEERNPGFVSRPFGMHWRSGKEWDMIQEHLRRLLGQSPLSHDLNDSNAINDNDYTKDELMRLVICCSTPFNPDQFPQESAEKVTVPMKIKLISNLPVNASRSNKEQSYLAKLAKLCEPKNLRWKIAALRFHDNVKYASFDYRYKLVWTWSEDDLAWEAVTRVTFQNSETLKFYFRRNRWEVHVECLWVFLEEPGMNKVLQQVYSKRGMDGTELREMLEDGRFSDLTIASTNGDKNKKEIRAHRVVLSAVSQHFAMMLNTPFKEAETGIVQLPESEEAIAAMLHFIYYGGTERILRATGDVVLELLLAGEIYMINDLVEVTAFVINVKAKPWNDWFSIDAAVKLFCFARTVDGQIWRDLIKKAVKFLEAKRLDMLKTCESYRKLYEISVKLGPIFESVLAMSRDGKGNKTMTFPKVPEGMPKTEVELIYDFLPASSAGGCMPRTLGIAVGILVLAEFCGREIPIFSKVTNRYFQFEEYSADFLVELFCTARLKEDKSWQNLKNIAVRKLKELLTTKPNEIEACVMYKEILSSNPEAAVELTGLI